MRVYPRTDGHLLCGHWNGSPVEIGLTPLLTEIPSSEVRHYHDYHEFYVVLEGDADLEIEGGTVAMTAGSVVMVEPRERHSLVRIGSGGVRWVIIKERSIPDSKHPA